MSGVYFTKDTENAIVEYNNTDCNIKRSQIYDKRIKYAFEKLAENIINVFKFIYWDVPKEDVQVRIISHMIQKMHMYEQDKGKAFSYFSRMAKNFCMYHNNKNYKNVKRHLSIDNDESFLEIPSNHNVESDVETQQFFQLIISHWERNITRMFDKERDIKIADAILELFRRRESIETFNKKALYLMIREITGVERTQHITKVVKRFKVDYQKFAENYYNTGMILPETASGKFFRA